jgi:aspartyl-tRNA(Asn)/glutamyl-tRNA(Gln) amidotransferase subunit A
VDLGFSDHRKRRLGVAHTSARAIADDVAAGTSSAAAQVDAALERTAATTHLNIFTRLDAAGARERAASIDELLARGENAGPLAGVPFVVKDLIDQAGRPNTCGGGFAPFTPTADAPCVARLEAAGAIPIGRVGLHEFAFGFSSENHWFGPVHNPLNPALSPGGSSGGSAAAVAVGIVPLALGTDTGGSVRVPAALCGIVGLKVTHGRGSLRGVYPLAPGLDTVGPLAATVADAELAYLTIGAHDPQDPLSVDRALQQPEPTRHPKDLRFVVPHPWIDTGFEPRIETAFENLLATLTDLGVTIEHATIPQTAPSGMGLASAYFEIAPIHRARYLADPESYGPDVRQRIHDALTVTEDEYAAALRWRSQLRAGLEECLGSYDAIITPTTAAVTKVIGEDTIELTTGPTFYRSPLSHFSAPVNNAGLPALALPVRDSGTPPLSLQLVGRAWSESQLLAIGRGLESAGVS